MPGPAVALAGATIGAGVLGARSQKKAAARATQAQERAAQGQIEATQEATEQSIAEQRRQFDVAREILDPYVQAGEAALGYSDPFREAGLEAFEQQRALAGLGTPEEEQAAIDRIMARPAFQESMRLGEEALLSGQAAIGRLRTGEARSLLSQFRPQLLNQAIQDQYNRFGGIAGTGLSTALDVTRLGQASAAGQAGMAQSTGANIGNLLSQQGQSTAGALGAIGQAQGQGALARGAAQAGMLGSIGKGIGQFAGLGGFGAF